MLNSPKHSQALFAALALSAYALSASADGRVVINSTNFPDANLRAIIAESDWDENGVVEGEEYDNCRYIYCLEVTNFKGLELLPLESLTIDYDNDSQLANVVKILPLTSFPNLRELFVFNAFGLETLDISANANLTYLRTGQLPALRDIKWSSALEIIDLEDMESLSTINGSELPNLMRLEVSSHDVQASVENFNFTGHEKIEEILIYGCDAVRQNVNALHVENCPLLRTLEVWYATVQNFTIKDLPQFESIYVKNTTAESISIQECENLDRVLCEENRLGTLELKNNPLLWNVECNDNYLQHCVVDGCPSMQYVRAFNNQLSWLDFSSAEKDDLYDPDNEYFQLDNQQPHFVAYKISSTEVGLRVHERLDVNRVSNLKAKGLSMEPREITVDGIRYFVIYNDGPSVASLVGASGHFYQYDTQWPYPEREGCSADMLLPVTYHVDSWRKPDSFIRVDGPTTLRGEYGKPAPATPGIIRSQDYDGALTWTSSNPEVVSVDASTGAMTVRNAGTVTITVSGAETDYRNKPANISFSVIIDKIKEHERVANNILQKQDDPLRAVDWNNDGKKSIGDLPRLVKEIKK